MKNEWPHLLADLKAKRDALTAVIATIETHFAIPDPAAPPASRRGPTNKRAVKRERTNERTNEQHARQRARIGASLT